MLFVTYEDPAAPFEIINCNFEGFMSAQFCAFMFCLNGCLSSLSHSSGT